MWAIWTERNRRVYEKEFKSGNDIDFVIQHYLKELDWYKTVKFTRGTGGDVWEPPGIAEVKANFDAAFDRTHFRSGSGKVARNPTRQIVASKAVLHEDVGSVFSLEALACRETIKMCIDLGLRNVILEGDSLTVIKKCRSDVRDRSVISPIIQDIKVIASRFNSIQFRHVKRTKNQLADCLATESLERSEGFYLSESVPSYAAAAIQFDEASREPD